MLRIFVMSEENARPCKEMSPTTKLCIADYLNYAYNLTVKVENVMWSKRASFIVIYLSDYLFIY